MGNTERVSLKWSAEFVARVDEARGSVSRNAWIRDAVEAALEERAALSPEAERKLREAWESPALERQFVQPAPKWVKPPSLSASQQAMLERQAKLNKAKGL